MENAPSETMLAILEPRKRPHNGVLSSSDDLERKKLAEASVFSSRPEAAWIVWLPGGYHITAPFMSLGFRRLSEELAPDRLAAGTTSTLLTTSTTQQGEHVQRVDATGMGRHLRHRGFALGSPT